MRGRACAGALLACLALGGSAWGQSMPAGAGARAQTPWWLPAATLRLGVFGSAPDVTPACAYFYLTPGVELRTRGRVYGLAAADWFAGGGLESRCVIMPEESADAVVYKDYGVDLEHWTRRLLVGLGGRLPVGPVSLEGDVGLGTLNAASLDGRSHRWLGGHLGGVLRGHLAVQAELGWLRVPIRAEAHAWPQPHTQDNMPEPGRSPYTTSLSRRWGRLWGVQLGLRF